MSRARDIADLAGSADAGGLTGRNRIINGNMTVAQRGTSFSSISSDQYTLDRWTSSSAGGVSLNVSQQTATSSDNTYFASKHFARYQRNAVLSGFVHKVEDLQQFNNKTFTLSFWAKSADAGTNVALTVYTVNDGSSLNSYVTQTYVTNPTLSSTWQKYEVRLAFQDMYAYGYSGSHHLRLQFFDGSNAATFDLTEVQLEVGETATPFEHEDYGITLQKCFRYFQTIGKSSGNTNYLDVGGVWGTSSGRFVLKYTRKRASASVDCTGGDYRFYDMGSPGTFRSITAANATFAGPTDEAVLVYGNFTSGTLTAGNACQVFANSSCLFTIDAEL